MLRVPFTTYNYMRECVCVLSFCELPKRISIEYQGHTTMHYNFSECGLDFGSGLRFEHCVCASLSKDWVQSGSQAKGPKAKNNIETLQISVWFCGLCVEICKNYKYLKSINSHRLQATNAFNMRRVKREGSSCGKGFILSAVIDG